MANNRLYTARCYLRNFDPADAHHFKYLLSPEIQREAGPYMPHTETDLPEHIGRICGSTSWLVFNKDTDDVLGDIGVYSIVDNKIGEMAWYFDPNFWGNGYAFEAGQRVLTYMFDELQFTRLSEQPKAQNDRSRRLAERLGFSLIAILPEANFFGEIADIAYYSIKNPQRGKM